MQTKFKYILWMLCVLAGGAQAASTADELARIEAETMLLKAQEKQLAVQAQIAARQAEIASRKQVPDQSAHHASAGDPIVRAIEGIGRILYATLQLDHGGMIDVKAGDTLPNGMTVMSISRNEVIAETPDKHRVRLDTGTVPQYVPPPSGMPLPPPAPGLSGGRGGR